MREANRLSSNSCQNHSKNPPADVPVRVREAVVPDYHTFPHGVDCIIISTTEILLVSRSGVLFS